MSLTVPTDLLERAEHGDIDDQAFLDCIRVSLPYAWGVITELNAQLVAGDAELADNRTPPPDESSRGQLLRLVASDAMRGAVERHFGVRLAFQNCHRVALFKPDAGAIYERFISPRAQLLNQSPEFIDC
jgi:hypothetical protein